ncbi:MAG: M28 family peptidase [Treponema lecithinolyticum]|uniref:M28 family peptidase n=1 Tax=Treponema lecithinolyticum TaxID=53418 RepID=UPI003FA21DBE
MPFLPPEFRQFIAPECDRRVFLQNWLTAEGIPFTPVVTGESVHLYVNFPSTAYNPLFKVKTILVHYDRALGADGSFITPGANDNSAAVYQVLCLAKRLLSGSLALSGGVHNVRIFFTDGEELGGVPCSASTGTGSEVSTVRIVSCSPAFASNSAAGGFYGARSVSSGAKAQGAFALASLFKKLGIEHDDVYVVDGCGRGEVLTVSTAGKDSPASASFVRRFNALFEHTCALAKQASLNKWISVPVPYSDNAGFLASGIPAVAVTMLPSDEASVYMRQLQKDKTFARSVMTHGVAAHGAGFLSSSSSAGLSSAAATVEKLRKAGIDPAEALLLSEKLPRTWRIMHTEFDNEACLTMQSFKIMERFLDLLALSRRCT